MMRMPLRYSSLILCLVMVTTCFSSCLQEGVGLQRGEKSEYEPRKIYPDGPYGTAIGEVIEPLSFIDERDEPYSLNNVYEDDFNQLLLVTTSAEWCTACIKEQPTLEALYTEFKPRGLEIVVTLFQDREFEPANAELSARWKDKYGLSFPVIADPTDPSKFSPYYDVSLTPMVMLVDVSTMEIIYLTQGFDEDQVRGLINSQLPKELPKPRTYPSAPYGKEVGDVIETLPFTTEVDTPFNTSQIYSDLSKSMLLLTTSAEWCTACIKEQPTLQAMYEEFGPLGLEIMVTLFQDRNFEPANAALASRWRNKYDLDFIIVADSQDPSILSEYYDVSLTPMVMLVELDTMEILYLTQGFDEDQVRGLIEAKLGTRE